MTNDWWKKLNPSLLRTYCLLAKISKCNLFWVAMWSPGSKAQSYHFWKFIKPWFCSLILQNPQKNLNHFCSRPIWYHRKHPSSSISIFFLNLRLFDFEFKEKRRKEKRQNNKKKKLKNTKRKNEIKKDEKPRSQPPSHATYIIFQSLSSISVATDCPQ